MVEQGRLFPEAAVETQEGEEGLPRVTEAMLETLTEGERDVIGLVGGGLSYGEMGRRLGLTLDGVKGRLKRARIKLRRFLGTDKNH